MRVVREFIPVIIVSNIYLTPRWDRWFRVSIGVTSVRIVHTVGDNMWITMEKRRKIIVRPFKSDK